MYKQIIALSLLMNNYTFGMETALFEQSTIRGVAIELNTEFIKNTRLKALEIEPQRKSWHHKINSGIESNWHSFFNYQLLMKSPLDPLVHTLEKVFKAKRLKKLENIWLDHNKKQRYLQYPLRKYDSRLLVLALFIAQEEDQKQLAQVSENFGISLRYLSK